MNEPITINDTIKFVQAMQRVQGKPARAYFHPTYDSFSHAINIDDNVLMYFFNKNDRALFIRNNRTNYKFTRRQCSKKYLRKTIAHIITTGKLPK